MSFSPILPVGGYSGWTLLQRTKRSQIEAFAAAPEQEKRLEYFRDNIGKITSAEQLVEDRQLLQVSLSAFGLSEDLNNTFFVRTLLEEGTSSPQALANKLADSRYKAFADAFAFDRPGRVKTSEAGFANQISDLYLNRSFEEAVGLQDETLRMALNAERELVDLVQRDTTNDARWFLVMGSPPLRAVFETALGLPSSFGELDVDKQLDIFRDKTKRLTGNGEIEQFSDKATMDKLIARYLLVSQLNSGLSMSSSQIALSLLGG